MLYSRGTGDCVPNWLVWHCLACAAMSLFAGCGHHRAAQSAQPLPDVYHAVATAPSAAATPSGSHFFHIKIFRIEAPLGTFSSNEDFWKTIDEQCVDPATDDLLQKNGLRVGVAPVSQMSQLGKVIDEATPVDQMAVTSSELKETRITMKDHLVTQNLFVFNKENLPIGKTFNECENALQLKFQPAPRRPGYLRVTMTPIVRALARQLRYTPLNNDYEVTYYNPELLYDLNLRADVPPDHFLIVTPSQEASDTTSVGNAFMIKTGGADRMEQVLLIVPTQYRMGNASQVSSISGPAVHAP